MAKASAHARDRRDGRDRCGAARKSGLQGRRKSIVSTSPRPLRADVRDMKAALAISTNPDMSEMLDEVAVISGIPHQYIRPPIMRADPMLFNTDGLESDSTTPLNDIEDPCAATGEPVRLDLADVSKLLDISSESDDFGGTLTAVNSGPFELDIYGWDAEWNSRQDMVASPPNPADAALSRQASGVTRSKSRRTALLHRVLGNGARRCSSTGHGI
jgi:hypothetical protein